MAQYQHFVNACNSWSADEAKNNWAAYWNSMATVTVNADGSLAGTNDGTVNNAHPINVPAASPLLISANQLTNGLNLLITLASVATWTSGVITAPNQNPVLTAAALAPNTLG